MTKSLSVIIGIFWISTNSSIHLRFGVHSHAQVFVQVSPQISLTTSQKLILNVNNICHLSRPLIGLKPALKDDGIIFATTNLHYQVTDFLHLVFLSP